MKEILSVNVNTKFDVNISLGNKPNRVLTDTGNANVEISFVAEIRIVKPLIKDLVLQDLSFLFLQNESKLKV